MTWATALTSSSGTLAKLGAGTLTLTASNTYTGTTTVSGGTLKLGNANALPANAAVPLSSTGILDLNGFNASVSSVSASATTNTITDNSGVAGTSTFNITNQPGTTISALIKDGTTRQLAVTLADANTSTPDPFLETNANTFSGGLTLLTSGSGTRMTISSNPTTVGSPGAISSSPFGTGAITIGQAATDHVQIFVASGSNATIANAIVVNSALGTDEAGTFRYDGTGNTLSGTINANLAPLTFNTGGTGAVSLTGQVTGASGLTLSNANGSSITVTMNNTTINPNNYVGDTTIAGTHGTLVLGAANQIPNGASTGNLADSGTFNMGGFSETINGLSGSGTVDGVSGTPTLTLGDNNATASFSGVIKNTLGTLGLIKIGTGTQTLSGANTYTGGTTVNAGTLILNGGAFEVGIINGTATVNNGGTLQISIAGGNKFPTKSTDTINVNGGGVLQYTNMDTQDHSTYIGTINLSSTNGSAATVTSPDSSAWGLRFGSVTNGLITSSGLVANTYGANIELVNGNSKTFTVTAANTLNITGIIKDYSTFTGTPVIFNGAGTVTLTGANTYTGGTTISGGVLQIGNGGTAGTLGSGAVVDNAALLYNQTSTTISNAISGTGTVTNTGNTGGLTIGANITMTGSGGFNLTTSNAATINTGVSLSVAGGTGIVNATTTSGIFGTTFAGTGTLTAGSGGSITIIGSSQGGGGPGGINLSGSTLTTSGTINLNGTQTSQWGIEFGNPGNNTIHATSGTTTLTGTTTTAGAGKSPFLFINNPTVTLTADPGAAIVLTGGAATGSANFVFQDFNGGTIFTTTGNVSFIAGANSNNTFWTNTPTFNVGASSTLTLDASATAMNNGLKIDPTVAMGANSTVNIAGSGTGTMTGNITLTNSTDTLNYNITGALTNSGNISGAGNLTNNGTGTVTLTGGANINYTGFWHHP